MIKRNDRGFSLVELVMVVGLTGILSVIAIPYLETDRGFKTQFLVDSLVSTLQSARERAVASGCAVRVTQNVTTRLLELYYYMPCNSNALPPQLIYTASDLDGVTVSGPQNTDISLNFPAVYFNAFGQMYPETFQNGDAPSTFSVTVTTTNGMVSVITTTINVSPLGFVAFYTLHSGG